MRKLEDGFSLTPATPISLKKFEDFKARFTQIGITLDAESSYFSIEGFPPLPVLDFEIKSGSKREIYMHQLFGTTSKGEVSINLHQIQKGTINSNFKYNYQDNCNVDEANKLLENIKSLITTIYSPKKTMEPHSAWSHN